MNVAVTTLSLSIVIVVFSVPVAYPLHPLKVQPSEAAAVRGTFAPDEYVPFPGVTAPSPTTISVKVYWLRMNAMGFVTLESATVTVPDNGEGEV